MSFREACAALGKDPGGDRLPVTPRGHLGKIWQPEAANLPGDLWREKAGKLVEWAHGCLLKSPEHLHWLSARGIGLETVKGSLLGWNPGEKGKDLWRPRESWGLPEEIKEGSGKPRRLWIPQGLVIPALDASGAVLRVRIRRAEGEPRYYVLPGSSPAPLYLARSRPAAVVVESELDALAVYEAAGDLAGAYAIGNDSAKPDSDSAARLGNLGCILIATDFDGAGAKASRWWIENFPQAERWPVPFGKDPGEAHRAGVNLREWVKAGLPPGLVLSKEEKRVKPPPSGDVLEGKTGTGQTYFIAACPEDLPELRRMHPGCAVFGWGEINPLWSMDELEDFVRKAV